MHHYWNKQIYQLQFKPRFFHMKYSKQAQTPRLKPQWFWPWMSLSRTLMGLGPTTVCVVLSCQPPPAVFHVLAGTWYGDVISSYTHKHKHPDVMNGVASCFPVFSMFFPLWALPPPSVTLVFLIDFCSTYSVPSLWYTSLFSVSGSEQLHPLSSSVIDPPRSLFTFTAKHEIQGPVVNKGMRAGFLLKIVLVTLWFVCLSS